MSRPRPNRCAECFKPIAGGKTGLCGSCWPKRQPPHVKYPWTDELDRMLRDAYSRCVLGKPTVAIDRLVEATGYPRAIVKLRAQRLGIARATRKPWRPEEIEFVRNAAGSMLPKQIAKALHRSWASVASYMEANRLRAKITHGYSVSQLADVLGISEHLVRQYLQRGWLSMDTSHRITAASVRHLLIDRMDSLDYRLMDQRWLKEQLRAILSSFVKTAQQIPRRAA